MIRNVYAPQLADSHVADLTDEFVNKTASTATPVVEVRFVPTPCSCPVLCASRGFTVMIWALRPGPSGKLYESYLLKTIVLEDRHDIITGMDLSRSWASSVKNRKSHEVNSLLVLGTTQGNLLLKKLSFKCSSSSSASGASSAPNFNVSPFGEIKVDAPISDVVIDSDPSMTGTDFLIAIVQGIRLSAVTATATGECQKYLAASPCHGVPIVSACCDTSGVFTNLTAPGSSFLERVNIVTVDSMGHAVIWRLSGWVALGGLAVAVNVQICPNIKRARP